MWEDDRYPTEGESFPGNTRREKIKLFLISLKDEWWGWLLIIGIIVLISLIKLALGNADGPDYY